MERCGDCSEESDRMCAQCDKSICERCDKSDFRDQQNMCCDCKAENASYYEDQNLRYWMGLDTDLSIIMQHQDAILQHYEADIVGKRMFLKKAFALLDVLDWDMSTVRTSNLKKRIKNLLMVDIDRIVRLSLPIPTP